MGDQRQRSKRQSRSKEPKLLKGFTLYLCANIDYGDVADVLEHSGIRVQRHRNHFHGSTPDTEILKKVGARRWILITADQKQRTRTLEKELIKQYKIRQFVLTSGQQGDVGELLVGARKKIRNLCKKNEGPFVASISKTGNITMRKLD